MSYADCETAFINTLATQTTYFTSSAHITKADFGILDAGITKGCAVCLPGNFGQLTVSQDRTYDLLCGIYYRFADFVTTTANLVAMREAIIVKIDGTPNLGDTAGKIWNCVLTGEGDPVAVPMRNSPDSGPVFLMQWLRATIYQAK